MCAQARSKGDLGKWKSESPNTKAGGNFQLPDPQSRSRSPSPCLVTTTRPQPEVFVCFLFSPGGCTQVQFRTHVGCWLEGLFRDTQEVLR